MMFEKPQLPLKHLVLSMGLIILAGPYSVLMAGNSQRPTEYKSKDYENIDYLGIKPPVPTEKPSPIDERPLWQLLSDKDFKQLDKLLKRYENSYPDWQPPSALIKAKTRAEIKQATDDKAASKILYLANKYPDSFNCDEIGHLWALGDALSQSGHNEKLITHYEGMINDCRSADHRLITLQRASSQLSYADNLKLIQLELNKNHSAFEQSQLDDFQYGFYSAWFSERWDKDSAKSIQVPLDYLQKAARQREDANIAALIGWWALNNKLVNIARIWFQQALDWQPDADKAYGLALALRDAKQLDASEQIIRQWSNKDARIASLGKNVRSGGTKNVARPAIDVALDKTIRYYNQGNYPASLAIAEKALKRSSNSKSKSVRALRLFAAWSLYNLGKTQQSESAFKALYLDQARIDSARGLTLSAIANKNYQALRTLGGMDCGPLSFLNSTRIPTDQPTVHSDTSDLYYAFYKSWIAHELTNKAYRSVELKILRIADQVMTLEDADMAAAAGWAYLDKGDLGSALFWFERALSWSPTIDNAYGLALVKRALGEVEDALQLTTEWGKKIQPEDAKTAIAGNLQQLHSELLLEQAMRAYDDKDYHTSLALAKQSAALQPSLEADQLIAWNKYKLGQIQQAADDFARIYRQRPDQQSATGLVTTLSALGKHDQLETLASELGGPLQNSLSDQMAIKHYYKDEFIPAAQTRISAVPQVKNADTPAISFSPYARHRSGSDGLAQLDMLGMEINARAFAGRHHFYASIDLIHLQSGEGADNAPLGRNAEQAFNRFNFERIEEESLVYEPMFKYRFAEKISPYIAIGTTPLGGEIGAALVGNIGVDWQSKNGRYNLEAFASNKQESILSTTGLIDPVTGESWGRVVETGIRGKLSYQFHDRWALTAGALYGMLDGRSVADNDHFSTWGSLAYNLDYNGLKYLTVGPSYHFHHYEDNRGFYTFGHGGYFSPESFHKLAAEINFQTDEGKQFVIKGRGALGYQRSDEADARAYPLTNSGPLLTAGVTKGITLDGQLSAVYRLGNWVQIGAYFNLSQAPNFTDIGGGVMLRFNAYDRPAVFSLDLPEQAWNF